MAGGSAYVLQGSEERHVLRVLRRGSPSILDGIVQRNAREHAEGQQSRRPWPMNREDVLYGYEAGRQGRRERRRVN
jgi:hypothetical protein